MFGRWDLFCVENQLNCCDVRNVDDDDIDAEYLFTYHEEDQFVDTVKGSKQSTEYEVNSQNSNNGRRRIKSLICQRRH